MTRLLPHRAGTLALALALSAAAPAALALQAGTTAQGLSFVSGGVSVEELSALHARRDAFSLWVITAASKSGSHLADVMVTIRDGGKREVFAGRLDGPWLFVDLPLGTYRVEATLGGQMQQRTTTIHRGDRHQLFFYFDTGDEVGAEYRAPFESNPYDGARKP